MTGVSKKKPAASRASRHTKKYMRKGTDVAGFEEVLSRKNAPTGSVEDTPVEELFEIDRVPKVDKKYTKRQQVKLDKLAKTVIALDEEADVLPAPKAPARSSIKRLRQPVARPEPVASKKAKNGGNYDLWDTDFTPKVDLDHGKAAEHFLRYTKKKVPSAPSTLRQKSSILHAVALPAAGASYNPTADDYQEYVSKIVDEETALIMETEKTDNALKPKPGTGVTVEERELEETEGLVIDPRYDDDDVPVAEEDKEASALTGPVEIKRKTKKQRETAARIAKQERIRLQKMKTVVNENDVFKAKLINKKLAKEEKALAEANKEKNLKKLTDRLTKRQRLGRGKFEEEEAPFLLEEELTDSLRKLKPQGNILVDRIKSMQKRNMLPIGGSRAKKLKTKLRRKFTEKRSAKEVKKGSRVI